MKLSYIKTGLIITGIISLIGFSYPLISTYIREKPEPYLSMALLNQFNMTEEYFRVESIVELNTPISWNIQIKNIGVTQLILIKVKIVDNLTMLPNISNCLESPSPALYKEYKIVGNNQIINVPFTWKLLNYGAENVELEFNGRFAEYALSVSPGQDLRMVFELWVYDLDMKDYVFRWESRTEEQCVWNYITFKVEQP